MASAPSLKRKAIDLESKYNALKEVDRGGSTKPDCIYNAAETGLFWKMQPKKSLVY